MWEIAFLGLPQLTTIPALVIGHPWQLAEAAAALARPGQGPAAASTGDGPAPPAPCVPVYPRDLQKILEEVPSELQEQPVR